MENKKAVKKYMAEIDTPDSIMEFLALFNQIDKYFDKILWLEVFLPYNEKIKRIIKWNYYISRFVKLHQFQLKYFWEIRNQITHWIQIDWHTYIQPTEYSIIQLRKYVKEIKMPPKCSDLFWKDVFFCHYDDKLKTVINTIEQKNYSHIPVYNRDERFIWILNKSNIISWLAHGDIKDINEAKVWDIRLINDARYVRFISKKVNVYEVDKLFSEKKETGEKIWVLLITENWHRNEPLLGIISAGDTAIIDSYVVH